MKNKIAFALALALGITASGGAAKALAQGNVKANCNTSCVNQADCAVGASSCCGVNVQSSCCGN